MKHIRSPNLAPGDEGIMVMVTKTRGLARGGLVKEAHAVRSAGRFGDTMLVHVNPKEFAQLKRVWGEPHYNPDTELPEFFDWWDAAKTVAPYVAGALSSKSSADRANQNLAPPTDANQSRPIANYTVGRTAIKQPHESPQSYYTYGQSGPETQFFKNNDLGHVTGPLPAPLTSPKQYSPSTGTSLFSGLASGALQYAMQNPEKVMSLFGKGAGGGALSTTGADAGVGGWAAPTAESLGAPASEFTMAGAVPGAADAGASAAAGGSGLLPGSVAGADMADTAAYTPSMIEATSPGAGAAGSGLGATLGGIGGALGLAVLGKHMQDNTAGLGYQQSRDLVNWYNDPHGNFTDPTHGRGKDASTPLAAPPPGFPSWTKYFMAQQIIGNMNSAKGGAKDQGTYKMILGELGLPTDQSFYSKAWPGSEMAYNAIMGTTSASSGHTGRARGGVIGYGFGGPVGPLSGGLGMQRPPMMTMPPNIGPRPGLTGGNPMLPPPTGIAPPPRLPPTATQPVMPMAGYGGALTRQFARPMGDGLGRNGPGLGHPMYGSGGPVTRKEPQNIETFVDRHPGDINGMRAAFGDHVAEKFAPDYPGFGKQEFRGKVDGPGTGTSDDIPARLSAGEYIVPAHVVAALGDGSTTAGAAKLDRLQRNVRRITGAQMAAGRHPKPSKEALEYMGEK